MRINEARHNFAGLFKKMLAHFFELFAARRMRQPTPENEVIGCGGKYSRSALAALAHLRAEKCFLPRTRRDKKRIRLYFAAGGETR